MGDRRQSRELALQALFFLDMNSSNDVAADVEAFCLENETDLTPTIRPFFMDLVQGVITAMDKIDPMLETCSKHWKVSRMPVVDRNIMRIAAFELLERQDIPPSVTINEAVDIAKKYSTRESGSFVNGILDRIRLSIGR
ncbi:MAG: transcription antitermination factor NusB [Desulfotignum sp.]|nr:transcription antitermination factor NusB [Desulfotignum sp.]MCF8086630.1 transcription antitermination factor NusB [Desulfotignum sp.]MCF8137332.1 transcription antitermination factor NusB [Desulfotignum sp.]